MGFWGVDRCSGGLTNLGQAGHEDPEGDNIGSLDVMPLDFDDLEGGRAVPGRDLFDSFYDGKEQKTQGESQRMRKLHGRRSHRGADTLASQSCRGVMAEALLRESRSFPVG